MKLIVGLGNPGPDYALTRHNIGFMAVDAFSGMFEGGDRWRSEHKALTNKIQMKGEQVLLVKPQTFMNLSGQSVSALLNFYKIPVENLIVVQDEVDLKFGELKIVRKRGPGGHNGIRSVTAELGTDDYGRLRLGVGKAPNIVDDEGKILRPMMETSEWVLKNFRREDEPTLVNLIEKACDAIEAFVFLGLERAANTFNQKG